MATNGDEFGFGPEQAFTRGNEGKAGEPKGSFGKVLPGGRIFGQNGTVTKWHINKNVYHILRDFRRFCHL